MPLSFRSIALIIAAIVLFAGLLFFSFQYSQTEATAQPTWNLRTGWNMVSIPVTGTGPSLSDLSQRCGQNTTFYRWNPARNQHDTSSTMTPGLGYWVRATRDCTVAIPGAAPWAGSVSLPGAGWHMVGAPAGGITIDDFGGNCQISSIQRWSFGPGSGGRYVVIRDRLEPGLGYFIRVKGACNLVFSESGATPPSGTTPPVDSSLEAGAGLIGQGDGKVAETYYEGDPTFGNPFVSPEIFCDATPEHLSGPPVQADFNSTNAMVIGMIGGSWYEPLYLFRDNKFLGEFPPWVWAERLCRQEDPGWEKSWRDGICIGSAVDKRRFVDRGLKPSTSYLYALRRGTSASSPLVAAIHCETTGRPEIYYRDYNDDPDPKSMRSTGFIDFDAPGGFVDLFSVAGVNARTRGAGKAYFFRGDKMLAELKPVVSVGPDVRQAPGWLYDGGGIAEKGLEPGTCYMYYIREGSSPSSNLLAARVGCTSHAGAALSCRRTAANKITVEWQTHNLDSPFLLAQPSNTGVYRALRHIVYKVTDLPATGKGTREIDWNHPPTAGTAGGPIVPVVQILCAEERIWESVRCGW